jgi:hypothetical protein
MQIEQLTRAGFTAGRSAVTKDVGDSLTQATRMGLR